VSTIDPTDAQVADKLAAFEQVRDPVLLYEALDLIEAAERDVRADDAAVAQQAFARRLRFLDALDRFIDPTWDPARPPVKGVPPPADYGGVVFPSGEVDPLAIADPAVRAEYERALKANKNDRKAWDIQFQLRQIDERAMHHLARFVGEMGSQSGEVRRSFEDALARIPLTGPRKTRVQALMQEPR
jgi:hypothetical protein